MRSDVAVEVDGSGPAVDEPAGAGALAGWRVALDRSTWSDRGAVLAALLLVVLFVPPLLFDGWTPRAAVLVALTPAGLYLLARLTRRGDRAAVALVAVLASVAVSCLLSGAVRLTLLGAIGRDMSFLLLAGTAAAWALGRAVSDDGRAGLEIVAVAATAASAAFGIFQVLLDVEVGSMALLAGRPSGFTTNPVFFAALSAAGLLCAVARGRTTPVWWATIALLAVATAWSESRVALVAALVSLAAYAAVHRERSAGLRASFGALMLVAGVLIDRLIGTGSDSVDRLLNDSGAGRSTVWRYGLEAWADRPVFGYGPGRFRFAVQDRFSADFVRVHAADDLTQPWFDAHNVVVNLLVSVGVVTTVLMLVWVVLWGRHVRGPLVWFLVALAATWALQPVSILTLPLAGLLFGAAGARRAAPVDAASTSVPRAVGLGLTAVGAALGLWLVVADVGLRLAADHQDREAAAAFAGMYLDDPVANDVVAQIHALVGDGEVTEGELEWRRRAADAEPDRPYFWSRLAKAQLDAGDVAGAVDSTERALALQPDNVRTLVVAAPVYIAAEDERALTDVLARMCRLDLVDCSLVAADVIARAQAGEA